MTSPTFQRKIHRARRALDAAAHAYPHAWKQIDLLRQQRQPGFDWPDWCYMPIAGGIACAAPYGTPGLEDVRRGGILTALGTWRMTQGIYRFDPALLDAVLDTPLDGEIPADHLQRLPEWCVYVDLSAADLGVPGAWMHLEYDFERGGSVELRIVFDASRDPRQPFADDGLESFALPLAGTIEQSLDALSRSAQAVAAMTGIEYKPEHGEAVRSSAGVVRPMLAIALYLCADADITRRGKPAQPYNPAPARSGSGKWTLHPASGPTEWDVGTRIGAALRAAYAREQTGGTAAPTGRHVRPHVRRAHWHTIVSGPRKHDDGTPVDAADRRRDLRWMPPLAVNVDTVDGLQPVIRPVR